MRTRRNFVGRKRWEVRTYPYGKKHARGGRNVRASRHHDERGALTHALVQDGMGYPEVEIVDLDTGRVVWSGGSGREFNPRKGKKRKRRSGVHEAALGRKPTRGQKRKERPRAIARGHSRKVKHKGRRPNPSENYPEAVAAVRSQVIRQLRVWIRALGEEGVPSAEIPDVFDPRVGKAGQVAADVLVSSGHAELRSKARLSKTPKVLAKELLQLGGGGFLAPFAKDHAELFDQQVTALAREITNARARVRRADVKAAEIVSAGEARGEEREVARLQKRAEALRTALTEEGEEAPTEEDIAEIAEQFSGVERQIESEKRRASGPTLPTVAPPEPPPAQGEWVSLSEPPRPAAERVQRRLGQYAQHRARVRRADVRPPLEEVANAREDVLLFALQDGTTQVWAKGALTETFLPDKNTASWTIAHRYANRWRGLNARGKLEPGAKKSRLRSRVLLAVEGQEGVKVIEESIAAQIGKVTQKAKRVHDLPDLDTYELKGDRANPKLAALLGPYTGNWPWAFFGEDGKVYDEPPEHVEFRAKRVPPNELKSLLKRLGAKKPRNNPRRRRNPFPTDPYKERHRRQESKGVAELRKRGKETNEDLFLVYDEDYDYYKVVDRYDLEAYPQNAVVAMWDGRVTFYNGRRRR